MSHYDIIKQLTKQIAWLMHCTVSCIRSVHMKYKLSYDILETIQQQQTAL